MSDRDMHKKGCLIACAAANLDAKKHWVMDHWAFARVVDRLVEASPGNEFAKSFWVFNGPAGRTCQDFDEALNWALHSSLISYLSPEYRRFVLMMGARTANEIFERYTEKERTDALEVMSAYLQECPY